jgi:hypothetical protein
MAMRLEMVAIPGRTHYWRKVILTVTQLTAAVTSTLQRT